ncbi:MAG: circularly permuted type 2 ATP-grasp protein [Chthoniobacterales bacterium]|nr:circularly permuted type 2 ATP-grasp protein [Chthoniobacterales bacterium]
MKGKSQGKAPALWDEVFGPDGTPRELYRPLLDRVLSMPRSELRLIIERLEATMREMGVTFDVGRSRPWGQRPWFCDVLPELMSGAEWTSIAVGLRQRLRAFELFLQDIHGKKEILRQRVVPAQAVLGSPYFQRPAVGLPRPGGAFLHLSGFALSRLPDGRMVVAHHYFAHASGISYMMQNRRALSRVFAEVFQDYNPQSIADAPVSILETFRGLAPGRANDPLVVLLTSGAGSPAYSEHSFLARRMGIPLVQGGDLLVLDDFLYLKSVSGLEKIDVLYTRVADAWLDSMVFRRDSLLGVSGLVQCVRRGHVSVVNAIGSQLADDRALLPFTAQIVRFYLGESEVLPTLRTWWLGDLDQRDHVLDRLDDYDIRPLYGERIVHSAASGEAEIAQLRRLLGAEPQNFVAQSRVAGARTVCFDRKGSLDDRRQDHIMFALRGPQGRYEIFPGALTRVSPGDTIFTSSELGGGSKDTWVFGGDDGGVPRAPSAARRDGYLPASHVTSRVADAFYWLGRYLERAQSLAYMVGVVESLETEELNRAERQLYRPVWSRILPPLEQAEAGPRRSMTSAAERYHLVLDAREEGSLASTLRRAGWNARQIQECLSVEAFGVLNNLEEKFVRVKFRPKQDAAVLGLATQKLCAQTTAAVAEFFGMAEATMLADRGWNFCRFGQQFERACITCNAGLAIYKSVARRLQKASGGADHAVEIELSAFLRMLGSRDAYRRLYQMRAEPAPVLRILYASQEMPKSVRRCLSECVRLLGDDDRSPGMAKTKHALASVLSAVAACDWDSYLRPPSTPADASDAGGGVSLDPARMDSLVAALDDIMQRTHGIHDVVTDGFINHQLQV